MPSTKLNSQKSTSKPSTKPNKAELKAMEMKRDAESHQAIADALATLVDNAHHLTKELYDALFSALPTLAQRNAWYYQPERVRAIVPQLLEEHHRAVIARHERWVDDQRAKQEQAKQSKN